MLQQRGADRTDRAVQAFLTEARAMAALKHPNVVEIHGVAEADGWYYIVMEYVDGESVQTLLDRGGRLDLARANAIVFDVANALAAAHSVGIVHGDIKPGNILLDRDGTVRVVDFGLAKSIAGAGAIAGGPGGVGTPAFVSPEQCDGMELGARSDIYSLGATYFAMVTEQPPFTGDNALELMRKHRLEPAPDPHDFVKDLPTGVGRIVATAMAKEPAGRFQTCQAFLSALSRVIGGEDDDDEPRTLPRTAASWQTLPVAEKKLGGGAAVVLAVVIGVLLCWQGYRYFEPVGALWSVDDELFGATAGHPGIVRGVREQIKRSSPAELAAMCHERVAAYRRGTVAHRIVQARRRVDKIVAAGKAQLLVRMLARSDDVTVRRLIGASVISYQKGECVDLTRQVLAAALDDGDVAVRKDAVYGAARLGANGVDLLTDALADDDNAVVIQAVNALQKLGADGKAAAATLARLAKSGNDAVKAPAAAALAAITGSPGS